MEALVTAATPIAVAAYVGEKIWQHRRHWFIVPKGWKLPKVEVACLAASVSSFAAVGLILG